jgi:N-acetyl-anhydromuramyl-L-alanine amidase AmpD
VGAHATGYNQHSIGICYEGGLDIRGRPADTRTDEQKETLQKLLKRLKEDYPHACVVGHRDLPGVQKDCPCYEVQ